MGAREAERLRPAFAGRTFERVLSSPLQRALETCRLAGLGDQVETTEDLMEWDYGEYEGITTEEIRKQRPDWYLWRDGCPGGESAADVGRRVDRVIAELRAPGKRSRCGPLLTQPTRALRAQRRCRHLRPRPRAAGADGALAGPGSRVRRPLQARYRDDLDARLRARYAGGHGLELAGSRCGTRAPMTATTGTNRPTSPTSVRPLRKHTIANATPMS